MSEGRTYAGYTKAALLSVTLDGSTIEALCEEIDLLREGVRVERERIAVMAERWADELQYNPAGLPETARRFREFAATLRKKPEP